MQEFQEQDYSEKLNMKAWKKIITYMFSLKKHIIIGVLAVIILSFGDVAFPFLNSWIINKIEETQSGPFDTNNLIIFGVTFFFLSIIQATVIFIFIKMAGKVEVELSYTLRKAAFEKIQSLSFSYFNKTPVGWIMARVTSDAKRLSEIISWGLIDMTWGFMLMVAITIVMFVINWKLALIALIVVPILAVISIYFRKLLLKLYRDVRKINSKITGSFNEGITGAKTSKTLVLEEKNLREFDKHTTSMRTKSIRAAMISSIFFPIVLTLNFVGTALVIYYGGSFYLLEAIEIGTLSLFISFSTMFFEPVLQMARVLSELQQAQASAERIVSLLEVEPDIVDTPEVIEKYGDYLHPKRENWEAITGDIEFVNVNFQYKDGEKVLNDFNLNVKAGETIALVGETGAGKSTIINLICRFFEPTEGRILIDGVDYKERSIGWLHSNLGYVLQSPHLFSGTIMENIRYGRLNATDEEVIEAAKLVDAHDFIMSSEKGYDTEVGEGGGRLSTGQKQLISFARAILANPAIFLLDEATSSIDTETEKKVQSAINKLLQGRTSFIIAHRLSTIVKSDKILVIKSGQILEQGTHAELINEKGYYYRLYTNQFIEEQTQKLGF